MATLNIISYVKSRPTGAYSGEILDATGTPAIVGEEKRISDSALSLWSLQVDGSKVEVGGAAENVPIPSERRIFTFSDLADPPDGLGVGPPFIDLSEAVNEVIDSNANGILDGLEGSTAHPDPLADTKDLLDDDGSLTDDDRRDLISWIRGVNVDGEIVNEIVPENRFPFPDPLHSSPVAITFGGTDEEPVVKLFLGTNDGGIRMINAFNGIEEWVFYPQAMLRIQKDLRALGNGDHIYGIDGVPAQWIFDADEDGIIEQTDGDFVRFIVGQRRGGRNYYALDVTPPTVQFNQESTGEILPKLMWRIEGGSAEFPSLGQTWSRPSVSTIRVGELDGGVTKLQDVIAFGGGYDPDQDEGFFGPTSPGNAVYIVDALTGALVFTVSATDPGVGNKLVYADMDCPVPSDLSFFDSNGDGTENRIYVGDLCGKVHRIDIRPNIEAGVSGIKATAAVFAQLSDLDVAADPLPLANQRKIFFRPSVVQVLNSEFTTTARYDLVVIVTGLRNNPLNLNVSDRVYALRDFHVDQLTDVDEDGTPDASGECPPDPEAPASGAYCTIIGPPAGESGTLFDATEVVNFEGDAGAADLIALQAASDGWFIDLKRGPGEKALAASDIISGALTFTTFLPDGVESPDSCSLAEGTGVLYGVDVLTGGVIFNFDESEDGELTLSDKTYTLGSGIPSSAVPIFQEEGITFLIGGGGGASTFDPNLSLPGGRTYWYEQ